MLLADESLLHPPISSNQQVLSREQSSQVGKPKQLRSAGASRLASHERVSTTGKADN